MQCLINNTARALRRLETENIPRRIHVPLWLLKLLSASRFPFIIIPLKCMNISPFSENPWASLKTDGIHIYLFQAIILRKHSFVFLLPVQKYCYCILVVDLKIFWGWSWRQQVSSLEIRSAMNEECNILTTDIHVIVKNKKCSIFYNSYSNFCMH